MAASTSAALPLAAPSSSLRACKACLDLHVHVQGAPSCTAGVLATPSMDRVFDAVKYRYGDHYRGH
jgi:hypothetical protein